LQWDESGNITRLAIRLAVKNPMLWVMDVETDTMMRVTVA